MRKLLILLLLVVLAAIGWGAFWLVGSSTMENVMRGWLDDRRAEGWTAEASAIETRGFPNRFDTTFEGLALYDPDTGVGFSTPRFQLLALSYKPNHVILVMPDEQSLETPDATYSLAADSMRGSIIVAPSLSLETESSTFEAENATIRSSNDWRATVGRAQVSMREHPGADMAHTYDVYMTLSQLDPGDAFLGSLKGIAGLPRVIENVTLSSTTRFDKAWDLSAIEVARPQPREVTIEQISAKWGDLTLNGSGALEIDVSGKPAGEMRFVATNWRDMVAIAEATGNITPERARGITRALELIAGLSGDREQLDVTVNFRRGITFLGSIPVGPAPEIKLP